MISSHSEECLSRAKEVKTIENCTKKYGFFLGQAFNNRENAPCHQPSGSGSAWSLMMVVGYELQAGRRLHN